MREYKVNITICARAMNISADYNKLLVKDAQMSNFSVSLRQAANFTGNRLVKIE